MDAMSSLPATILKDQTVAALADAKRFHAIAESIKPTLYLDPAFAESVIRAAAGHIYCVEFVKRGNGELRRMTCRCGKFPPPEADTEKRMQEDVRHACLTVWEMAKGGAWKRISLDSIVSVTSEGHKWVAEPCWRCGKPTASDGQVDPLYCAACARAAQSVMIETVHRAAEAIRDGTSAFCVLDERERFEALQSVYGHIGDAICVLAHRLGYDEPTPAERREIETMAALNVCETDA
jgi:hypothetical protein